LMWGVGNELDQFAKNYNVWNAVNDLAQFIHEVDPNHPTTTMLAGVPKKHVAEIIKRAPHIDILSINAFKWIEPVKRDITSAGWKGPFLMGEWGPSGYWESDTVPWGTFIEETSTEKAKVCAERYKIGIKSNPDRCIGSYVFFWGTKQARTHTLLSLISEKGEGTEVLDFLQTEWTGKAPSNRSPKIVPIGIDDYQTHKGVYLKPSSLHKAYTEATDPDGDQLVYYWELYHESKEKKEGGDTEAKPAALNELILDGKGKVLSFKAPQQEGPYRLFVSVYDGHKHMATANTPFYVKK
ncbi:MAG: beta-galactosidase, partial [Bacteroidetes bacterium]|nr:beta-galactosidase [Bacteroidota bacterium]